MHIFGDCASDTVTHFHTGDWVGNCVGRNNYRYFVTFLMTTTLCLTIVCAGHVALLVFKSRASLAAADSSASNSIESSEDSTTHGSTLFHSIGTVILVLLKHADVTIAAFMTFIIFTNVSVLAAVHFFLCMMGQTTNEWVCKTRHTQNQHRINKLTDGWWQQMKSRIKRVSRIQSRPPFLQCPDLCLSQQESSVTYGVKHGFFTSDMVYFEEALL